MTPAQIAAAIAPEPYTVESAAREAAEKFWASSGWDPAWVAPSIENLADHLRPYISEAMRRGAESVALRGAA